MRSFYFQVNIYIYLILYKLFFVNKNEKNIIFDGIANIIVKKKPYYNTFEKLQ
jgi:hypothetical protein